MKKKIQNTECWVFPRAVPWGGQVGAGMGTFELGRALGGQGEGWGGVRAEV